MAHFGEPLHHRADPAASCNTSLTHPLDTAQAPSAHGAGVNGAWRPDPRPPRTKV